MKIQKVIELNNVSKKYIVHQTKPTLIENFFSKNGNDVYFALNNINMSVKQGERVGIVGPNGSGKTTLLKILTGITTATSGNVMTKGKIVSVIEIEGGFQPELTGYENIKLNSLILGMPRLFVEKNIASIVRFADIGKFIHAPFYTYSSGMKLRLGFSIAIHTDPDILVLDENIAVGDAEFKDKSYLRLKKHASQGKTIILATHSFEVLKSICDRAIWLYKGKIRADGSVTHIINLYKKVYAKKIERLKRINPNFRI